MSFITQNPIDGLYETWLDGVNLRSETYDKVEAMACDLALQRAMKARVEESLDMLDKQPTSTWPEIGIAVMVVVLFVGLTAVAAWLW